MKKTKAFSLEEDVIQGIEEYRQRYKLSSLSSALERIILIELPKRTDLEEIKNMISNLGNTGTKVIEKETVKETSVDKVETENEEMKSSINDIENSMPE